MNKIIAEAIARKQVLRLQYGGITRLVEPHVLGLSKKGVESLLCYQVGGQHQKRGHAWALLTVSKITGLINTGAVFDGPRPDYVRDDERIAQIEAQL